MRREFAMAILAILALILVGSVYWAMAAETQVQAQPSLRTEAGIPITHGTMRRVVDHEAGLVCNIIYSSQDEPTGIDCVSILDTEFGQPSYPY